MQVNIIPAVREPASIAPFFKALAQTTVPGKVDANFMAGIGFRRQTDVKLLELLHHLGFMDNLFQPTTVWKSYFAAPDEEGKMAVLGAAVAEKYSGALRIGGGDDPSRLSGKAVMAYFKTETGASDTETAYMALTLQILMDLVKMPAAAPSKTPSGHPALPDAAETVSIPEMKAAEGPITLTLNITLDPAADPELHTLIKLVLEKTLGK